MNNTATPADDSIEVEMTVSDGRTILTIEGQRDATVIVRSESGERIYLPPEDFDADPFESTPYSTTPYSMVIEADEDSGPSPGRDSTPTGIRIVHPEPVTDVRLVR